MTEGMVSNVRQAVHVLLLGQVMVHMLLVDVHGTQIGIMTRPANCTRAAVTM